MIDQTAVRQFLEAALPTGVPTDSFLPIWTDTRNYTSRCDTVDQALDVLARQSHCNLYLGNLVRRSLPHGRRGTSADVTHVFALKIDIDIADGQHTGSNLAPDLEAALAVVMEHSPIPHSALVFTGGGIQAWWFLELTNDLTRAADLSGRFTRYFQERSPYAVDSTQDLARVFRLPGSINWKTGAPRPTQLLALDPAARYALDDIEAVLPAAQPRRQGSQTPQPKAATGREIHRLLSHIPGLGLDYDEWLAVLMAVAFELGNDALEVLEAWTGQHSNPGELAHKLASFKSANNPRTIGTLRRIAVNHGWRVVDPALRATRTVHRPYLLPEDLASAHRLVMVKSGLGSGKTEALSHRVTEGSLVVPTHRHSLARNLGARLGATYFKDIDDPQAVQRVTITVNSLLNLGSPPPAVDNVVLDDVEQIMQHLLSRSFQGDPRRVYQHLKALMRKAGRVTCMDANLSQTTVEWFARLMGLPVSEVEVIENTWHESALRAEVFWKPAVWTTLVHQDVAVGLNLMVNTNNKAEAEDLAAVLQRMYPSLKLLLVTRDTLHDAQAILDEPGCPGFSDYQVVISTPAISTGVSIDGDHFDRVYALGDAGITMATDFVQQVRRVRTPREGLLRVCLMNGSAWRPEEPAKMFANELGLVEELTLRINEACDGIHEVDREYAELHCDITALRNRSLNAFPMHVLQLLRDEGIPVVDGRGVRPNPEHRGQQRLERTERKESAVTRVVDAPEVSALDLEVLRDKARPTPEERAILDRHDIATFYGPDLDPEVVRGHLHEGLRHCLTLFIELYHPDIARQGDLAERELPGVHRQYHVFRAELLRSAFRAAGLGDDFTGDIDIRGFEAWLMTNREEYERVLRRGTRDQVPTRILGDLLRMVGLRMVGKFNNATRTRTYRVDQERAQFVRRLMTQRQEITSLTDSSNKERQTSDFLAYPPGWKITAFIASSTRAGQTSDFLAQGVAGP